MRRRTAKRAAGSEREETADGAVSPKRNVNDSLAAALGCEIIAGLYPPGSRLPNEASLLVRFGVSRPTLREAFRALEAKGLIVSRQKVGTMVRPKADWHMLDADFLAWHMQAAPTEVFVSDVLQLQAHFRAAGGRARRRSARRSVAGADRGGLRRHGGAQVGRRRADRRRRALPQGNPPGERQPPARRARQPDRDGAGGHVQDGLAQPGDQGRPPPPAPRRDAGDRRPASRGGARGDGQAAAGIGRRRAPRARPRPRHCPQLPPEPARA